MARYRQGETIKKIFGYDDYRLFLKDFFSEQKSIRESYTQRYFAKKAGFSSHAFCPLVIKGLRSLTGESIEKIIKALPLKNDAAEFFRTLVKYNQCASAEEKQELFGKLKELREGTKFSRLDRKAFPFFDKWYYPAVRALAAYSDWGNDYRKLAKMVLPPISMDEARTAVESLVASGMLVRESYGRCRATANKITTAGIPAMVRNKNRREILQQCISNTESMTPQERYLAYTTLATSENTYKKITEYLDTVRSTVIDMVMADEHNEKVYELVFNVVPFSSRYARAVSGEQNHEE
jgi:uncharacterized protein (TIGR02147 family)